MLAISGSGSHAHITEISPSDIQGTAGKDGPQGFHGAKGPPGPPGPTGHQGAIGTTGEPGDIAPDSADGDQGPPVSINCSAAFIHSRAHEERGGGGYWPLDAVQVTCNKCLPWNIPADPLDICGLSSQSLLRVTLASKEDKVNMERSEILVIRDQRVPMVLRETKDQQDLTELPDHVEQKETKALRCIGDMHA